MIDSRDRDGDSDFVACWLGAVAENPGRVAITDGAAALTHAQLDVRTSAVASMLSTHGVGPERIVALDLDRPTDLAIGAIAVLRAGGAFVTGRGAATAAHLSLCRDADGRGLAAVDINEAPGHGDQTIDRLWSSRQLAYVLFTSGSTGAPKGVMIERGNLGTLCRAVRERLALSLHDLWLQLAVPTFDVFIEEVFPLLSVGGTVVCSSGPRPLPFDLLQRKLEQQAITIVELTTQYFYGYLRWLHTRSTSPPSSLRTVVVGGERMDVSAYRDWQEHFEPQLVHVYGITETSVSSTMYAGRVAPQATSVPVGTVLRNATLGFLRSGRPSTGESGEITLGGPCVGRGYLGDPARTAERFVPDPEGPSGSRRYLSGDLGHLDGEGNLVIEGRIDDELKIRGQRVRISAVERGIETSPEVTRAIVIPDPRTGTSLSAFVELNDGRVGPLTGDERARILAPLAAMSSVAIPARVIAVVSFPSTLHGKVDRTELARLVPAQSPGAVTNAVDLDHRVLGMFRRLLASPELRLDDDFFDYGGDSLLALSLVSEIAEVLGTELSTAIVFDAPTPRQLALRLESIAAPPHREAIG